MEIQFFDDGGPKPREEVRIKQLGLYMYEDGRRVAVGFNVTPFLERPSIEVSIKTAAGKEISSLHVIETLETNFSLTMHLRHLEAAEPLEVTATVYYATPETERVDVHTVTRRLDPSRPGEQ